MNRAERRAAAKEARRNASGNTEKERRNALTTKAEKAHDLTQFDVDAALGALMQQREKEGHTVVAIRLHDDISPHAMALEVLQLIRQHEAEHGTKNAAGKDHRYFFLPTPGMTPDSLWFQLFAQDVNHALAAKPQKQNGPD